MQFGRISRIRNNLLVEDFIILLHEFPLVNQLLRKEMGISRFNYFYFTHHLTHNNLEMFVVDLHSLHTVNLLNLIYDILLHLYGTLDSQNVGGRDNSVRQGSTSLNVVIVIYKYLLGKRYQINLLFTVLGGDDNLLIAV